MAVLSEEQALLRDMAADWARERAPVTAFRHAAEAGGHDPALYAEMAEMGWAGVLVPEAHGGADFGALGLGLVLEALGRTLVASPLLSTAVIGASALRLGAGPAAQAAWLPRIAGGEVTAALALDEGGRHDPARIATTATREGGGWRVRGVKTPVIDGMTAGLLLVAAETGDGVALLLVEPGAAGVTRAPLHRIDGREAATIGFEDVAVGDDAVLRGGANLLDRVLDRARAALAAEMLGSATQAFETTLDYLKTRVQFGQLIGSFQALQHRAVAMHAELVVTRSAVEAALVAVDADATDAAAADAAMLVSLAKALAGDTLRLIAREMVQMHGGIGMTEEHDAGLYYKRAAAADALWGNSAFHRERYARLAGY